MAQLRRFQITPYSDEVATYVNSLSGEEIYGLFATTNRADILTAALRAVYEHESNALKVLLSGRGFDTMWILSYIENICPGATNNINDKAIKSLGDVFLRDSLLYGSNLNSLRVYPHAFVLINNGMYSGHIYTWTSNAITNIIGIRSSLLQILGTHCGLKQGGIATIFLSAIREFALSTNAQVLRVVQPIGPMPDLLKRCGFVLSRTVRNTPGFEMLFDGTGLDDMPMTNMLIFREYDYIMSTTHNLQCYPPSYTMIN